MLPEPNGEWPWRFFELAGAILLGLDPDGRVIYINQKGAETLGYPIDEILGRDWFETFLPERIRDQVRTVFRQVNAGAANAPTRYENPVLCRDGSERLIYWRNGLARDAEGRLVAGLASGKDVTDQRNAEAAQRESEARFRATFEQAAVGMALVALDGRFLRLNRRLCEITGYEPAELEARTFADITHPEDVEADLAQIEELRAGRIPHYRKEKRYIRKDGSTLWANLTASLLRDGEGNPACFVAVLEDIMLRKRAEMLSAAEELQRMALGAAEAGAWEWDGATGRQTWTEDVYGIFGLDPLGGPPDHRAWLHRCVHPEDRAAFEEMVGREAAAGEEFRIEFRSSHPDKGLRWIVTSGRLSRDAQGTPVRAWGLVQDITERRRLADELAQSEERLRLAMAAGGIGVWELDIPSGQVAWSENFTDLMGIDPEDFATTLEGWRSYVHPDDRQRIDAALDRALSGESDYNVEFRMVNREGRARWTASRASILRDRNGAPVRMIGIDMDVTERKAAEERRDRTAGEMEHRVRNLFGLIRAIAGQTLPDAEETADFLGRLDSLARAHALLLRGGDGQGSDAVNVAEIIAAELAPYPAGRVRKSGPNVLLDPEAAQDLAMILHELATNAAKHGALSGAAGTVSVTWSVSGSGRMVTLRWTESGGPPVSHSRVRGFGSRLLEGSAAGLGGKVELEFDAGGLQAVLNFPVPLVAAPA